jgi:hypothetical protein
MNNKVFVPELRKFSMFLCLRPFCRKTFHKEKRRIYKYVSPLHPAASAACLRRLPLKEAGALRPIEFFSPDTFCNFYTASIPELLHTKVRAILQGGKDQFKVLVYKEHHSVCPLVGIGTPPPP